MGKIRNIWYYLENYERPSKNHLGWLIVSSLILLLFSNFDSVPGIMDSMQFREKLDGDFVKGLVRSNGVLAFAYYGYFALDCIWPVILLAAILKYVRNYVGSEPRGGWKTFYILFSVLVVASYVSDLLENGNYVVNHTFNEILFNVKIGLYAGVVLCFLVVLILQYVKDFVPALLRFVKSAGISLFILLVIGLALPRAPQVNSIIVNLYESPFSFLVLLLAAPVYAVVMAHYPSYFSIQETHRKWYRAERDFGIWGTIFYKYKDGYAVTPDGHIESKLNFFYRVLGILFYAALFYVIAYTSETNFDWPISTANLTICLLTLGVWLLYDLKNTKSNWLKSNQKFFDRYLPDFYDGDFSAKSTEETATDQHEGDKAENESEVPRPAAYYSIADTVYNYLLLLIITVLVNGLFIIWLITISVFLSEDYFYTEVNVFISLLCVVLQMFTFIYFRSLRSVFRFVFFNENIRAVLNAFYILRVFAVTDKEEKKVDQGMIDKKEEKIRTFFGNHSFKEEHGLTKYGRLFGYFAKKGFGVHSNNISFLQFVVGFGLANILFFVGINIFNTISLQINPIIIILSAFFLYYGIVVVLTKNLIYYKYSKETFAEANRKRYYYVLAFSFLFLFLANRAGRLWSNQLFDLTLREKKTTEETLSLSRYVDSLPTSKTRYYIGAYGGGMKSNAWTMTVLHQLMENDPTFLDRTIGISGVSGGTMGLINMAAIMKNNDREEWLQRIWDISTENILSMDLTHILGRDTFNHMLVAAVDLKGADRSSSAMARYDHLANGKATVCNPSFRHYWFEMYDTLKKRFPILIANTTNVGGNQGMAVSVDVQEDTEAYSLLYHGADNILDIEQKDYDRGGTTKKFTLSYYDAASTSNRFPVISPAAKIETKGHYNDGGIYENSGLLSVFKLYRAISHLEKKKKKNTEGVTNVFINIVNDKNQYIQHYIAAQCDSTIKANKVNKNTEINAILNSVAATEMMPIFIKEELKRLEKKDLQPFKFTSVYLPHRFTVAEVKGLLGTELDNGFGQEETNRLVYKWVVNNDKAIRNLVMDGNKPGGKAIIEPPMSRVMAKDAFQFMREMMAHKVTRDSLMVIHKRGR
ncbi:MAG: hypothetical protein AAGC45_13120 [Bacteroidota bacterium]